MSLPFDSTQKKPSVKTSVKRPRSDDASSSTEQLSETKHEDDQKSESRPIRLFYCTTYFNGTPFPSVGLIKAYDEKHAGLILDARLLDSGLLSKVLQEKEYGNSYTILELDIKEPGCFLLTSGRDIFK